MLGQTLEVLLLLGKLLLQVEQLLLLTLTDSVILGRAFAALESIAGLMLAFENSRAAWMDSMSAGCAR